ncbi:AAA family ATPase [bacterium]|nr:AAA family ATPase [bacterium]
MRLESFNKLTKSGFVTMNENASMTDTGFRNRVTPQSFPRPVERFTIVETHISLVFLTETHVYKTKKSVKFPFLDYSTLEKRLDACREEVRVNRRLAPDVYLGIVPITKSGETIQFGGDGPPIDYAVEMARLPDEKMLDHRITSGTAHLDDIHRLLDILIPFYDNHSCEEAMRPCASVEAIWNAASENIETMKPLLPPEEKTSLSRIRSSQLQFLNWERELFVDRLTSSEIIEGHGDLRPEHICLLDPPVVFDAVEFSQSLRTADVISELAFLAMECDFLNAPTLGRELIEQYQKRSNRQFPRHLISFYQAYRATVRAKVHLLQMNPPRHGSDVHQAWFHRYMHLAIAYASDFHLPMIIVVMGLSGVGKSTIAKQLSESWGMEWIRTDQVRQELMGKRDPNAPFGQGMYSDAATIATYHEVAARTARFIKEGVSVVVDGTFLEPAQRESILAVGRHASCPIQTVWCDCPELIARERINRRREHGIDISDARLDVYEKQVESFDVSELLTDPAVVRIDTSESIEAGVEAIRSALRRRLPH